MEVDGEMIFTDGGCQCGCGAHQRQCSISRLVRQVPPAPCMCDKGWFGGRRRRHRCPWGTTATFLGSSTGFRSERKSGISAMFFVFAVIFVGFENKICGDLPSIATAELCGHCCSRRIYNVPRISFHSQTGALIVDIPRVRNLYFG